MNLKFTPLFAKTTAASRAKKPFQRSACRCQHRPASDAAVVNRGGPWRDQFLCSSGAFVADLRHPNLAFYHRLSSLAVIPEGNQLGGWVVAVPALDRRRSLSAMVSCSRVELLATNPLRSVFECPTAPKFVSIGRGSYPLSPPVSGMLPMGEVLNHERDSVSG